MRCDERRNVIQESVRVAVCPTVPACTYSSGEHDDDYGQWAKYFMLCAQDSGIPVMLCKHLDTDSSRQRRRRRRRD